jgi:hypothetical protein
MKVSLFRNGISQKKDPQNIDIQKILTSIKSPSTNVLKNKVTKLRSLKTKKEKSDFKKKFPYVTFSGVFEERAADKLIEHSGFIVLDFDDLEHLEDTFEQLKSESYIFAMFVSPRGTGLKILVKINPNKHLDSFLELEKYFSKNYNLKVDPSGKDVCRACFLTYDPNLFQNQDSKLFSIDDFYTVDTDTGEIYENTKPHYEPKESQNYDILEHCKMVASRIEASGKDLTTNYADWNIIAFSLASLGESGRDIFHQVSRMYPEYNFEKCSQKFDNAIKTTRFTTPGKFFTVARDNFIDISFFEKSSKKKLPNNQKTRKKLDNQPTQQQAVTQEETPELSFKEIREKIKHLKETLDGLVPNTEDFKTVEKQYIQAKQLLPNAKQNKAKPQIANFNVGEDLKEGETANADVTELEDELRRKLPEGVNVKDYMNYGFYEHKNCYYMAEKEGVDVLISNFTMKIKFLIRSKTEPKRLVEIKNIYGEKALIDMNIETMISLSKFCQSVESEGNFLFEGKDQHLKRLKRKLFKEEKSSEEISFLGYQKKLDVYVFSNGIFDKDNFLKIDDYGIVELLGRNIYIPALSKINDHDNFSYENERKFIFKKTEITFEQWAKIFCDTYGEKGTIAIGFYIAALFRDIIFEQTRFFPILNLFGAPGTGKTTMASSLMYLFGNRQEPFMLGGAGTPKGFMRKFGQFCNALIWLDEFKNSIDVKKIESLKNVYDGVGYEKALMTQDSKTKTTPIYSACILSGEELPTGNEALFKRVVFLDFETEKFSELERESFEKLVKLEEKGLSSFIGEILKIRDVFSLNFSDTFAVNLGYLHKETSKSGESFDDRIIRNYAVILASLDIAFKYFQFPFNLETARKYFVKRIIIQNGLIANSSKVSKFFDVIQFLFENKQIVEGSDFKIKDNILLIRLSKIHPLYLEAHNRQFGDRGLDKASLVSYLEKHKSFKNNVKSERFDNDTTVTSAYAFDLNKLEINLTYIPKETQETQQQKDDDEDLPF